jgi:acetoacetyl-CoA reductase
MPPVLCRFPIVWRLLAPNPLGRLGRPEEIAGLIIYPCSDEAAFVTGTNIAINGGQHMQ